METTADVRMKIVVQPLDDAPAVTLGFLSSALGIFLSSTSADVLDGGQDLMLREAMRRIEQVESELPDAE